MRSSTELNRIKANNIREAVMDNIGDRRGFHFDNLDEDVLQEIKDSLENDILKVLEKESEDRTDKLKTAIRELDEYCLNVAECNWAAWKDASHRHPQIGFRILDRIETLLINQQVKIDKLKDSNRCDILGYMDTVGELKRKVDKLEKEKIELIDLGTDQIVTERIERLEREKRELAEALGKEVDVTATMKVFREYWTEYVGKKREEAEKVPSQESMICAWDAWYASKLKSEGRDGQEG